MTERAIFIEDNASNSQSGPYSMGIMDNMVRAMMGWPLDNVGIIRGAANELSGSVLGGAVRIATGYAHIQGMVYWNDANVDLTPTTPVVGTTRKRVVLRKLWDDPISGSISVKLAILEGTDGVSGTNPALTQTDGVKWEIPLYHFDVSTAAVISNLVSEREFYTVGGSRQVEWESMIETGGFLESDMIATGAAGQDTPFVRYTLGSGLATESQGSSIYDAAAVPLGTASSGEGFGVIVLNFSASAASGLASITSNATAGRAFPTAAPRMRAIVKLADPASNANYVSSIFIGLARSYNASRSTNDEGVGFECTLADDMYLVSHDGTSETTVDLNTNYRDGLWHSYEVYTPDYGLTWVFLVDGIQVGTITTNVPPNTSPLYAMVQVHKSSTNGASVTGFCEVDYMSLEANR